MVKDFKGKGIEEIGWTIMEWYIAYSEKKPVKMDWLWYFKKAVFYVSNEKICKKVKANNTNTI